MKVLFVGPLLFGSTTIQRYFSMKKLKLHLNSVNTINTEKLNFFFSLYYNILEKIGFPKDLSNANKNIIKKIKKFRPDILWLDKSITITANTLSSVREICKKIKIIGYSPDYMSRSVNTSHFFNKSLKYYDAFFTTKSYGVKEIKKLGAKKVFFINNSFDSYTHKKIYLTNKQKSEFYSPVGFIGTWEKQRAEYIYEIAASGFLVKWWGSVSKRHLLLEKFYSHPNLVKYNFPLIDKKYTKALNSFDIALCFLRKDNMDLQTTRSVEIPACGSFMLAERTEEHLKLFQEGKEAEFFSSKNELLGKIRYYLKNPKERIRIAEAGKKRCERSGYSNYKVIYKMIKLVTR